MAQLGETVSKPPQPATRQPAKPAHAREAPPTSQEAESRETGIRKFGEALKRQRLLREAGRQDGPASLPKLPVQEHIQERAAQDDAGTAEDLRHQPPAQPADGTVRFAAGQTPDPAGGVQARTGTAGDAAAFADYVARLALSPQRDEQRLRLAFSQNGWPVSELTLSRTADGRLMLVLGLEPGQRTRVERQLEELRERLAARGGSTGGIELVTV